MQTYKELIGNISCEIFCGSVDVFFSEILKLTDAQKYRN